MNYVGIGLMVANNGLMVANIKVWGWSFVATK
jgi:hypothetical protein